MTRYKGISLFMMSFLVAGCGKTLLISPCIPEPSIPVYGHGGSKAKQSIPGKRHIGDMDKSCDNDAPYDMPLAEAIPGWTDAHNSLLTRENAYHVHLDEISRHQRMTREKMRAENAIKNATAHDDLERFEKQHREMKKRTQVGPAGNSSQKPINVQTHFNIPAHKN